MRRAFSLTELLVVIAVLAVLSAILFPVLSSAKAAAQKTRCMRNLSQATIATNLYLGDYDDYFPPPSSNPGSRDPSVDRTWVQLLMPYVPSFGTFLCPSDTSERPRPDGIFDTDVVPGDTYSRFYEASLRSDIGFNYLYLSPVVQIDGAYLPRPRSLSEISDQGSTVLFSDSVWSRTEGGVPVGGGNYLIVPPCRFEVIGSQKVDTFQPDRGNTTFYTNNEGWQGTQPLSPYVYGGAWPWHAGRMNVAGVGGAARSMSPGQLRAGCDLGDHWAGLINDPEIYIWDLR